MLETSVVCECGSDQILNQKRNMCSPCYYHWYNTTQRDREKERLRVKAYNEANREIVIFGRLKKSAEKKGVSFNLTPEFIKEKLDKGLCEITGLPIIPKTYKKGDVGKRTFFGPSFDRIDNTRGYTKDNIRVVCWAYNLTKNCYTDREVIAFAISSILEFVHVKQHKELLSLIPNYFLSALPEQSKYTDLIKEIQVGT